MALPFQIEARSSLVNWALTFVRVTMSVDVLLRLVQTNRSLTAGAGPSAI